MNRYGRMALTHTQRHRPKAMAAITDPNTHFTELGEQIQIAVTVLRDQLLGPQRSDETIDGYRLRGYQALKTAEEAVLADLLWTPTEDHDEIPAEEDPVLAGYYRDLDEISETTQRMSEIG